MRFEPLITGGQEALLPVDESGVGSDEDASGVAADPVEDDPGGAVAAGEHQRVEPFHDSPAGRAEQLLSTVTDAGRGADAGADTAGMHAGRADPVVEQVEFLA